MEDLEMNENDRESTSGFTLIEMSILSKVLSLLACPNCYNTSSLKLTDVADKKKGLSSYLKVYCEDCTFVHKSYNSPVVTSRSIPDAGACLRKGEKSGDAGVSVNCTWQRKGFSAILGVVTTISIDTGKVLDVSILLKSRKGCTSMAKIAKSNPNIYEVWKLSHKCNLNYTGSSSAMETAGATKTFGRSVEKHGLYYTSFYGDGDSKAYPAVKEVYKDGNKTVTKYECIGHYQKTVGCRLRKLKKNVKGLGGKGRLADAKIGTLQNYSKIWIALRQNVGKLNDMRKSCLTSMYHVARYHDSCPRSKDSWCQYQVDKLNNTNLYKSKGELPIYLRKGIYNDLFKEEILKKYLQGKTQNANESFNGRTWNRISKATYVGLTTLCSGIYDAVSHFNYGQKAALDTIRFLDIDPGICITKSCGSINKKRKHQSIYKTLSRQEKCRKILIHSSKKRNDKIVDQEGTSYEAEGF